MADVIRAHHTRPLIPRSPCWWSIGLGVNAAYPKLMRTSLNNTHSIYMVIRTTLPKPYSVVALCPPNLKNAYKWSSLPLLLKSPSNKGQVTQAPITRTKTITIKMHAFDWLNEHEHILRGAIQQIKGVHFYHFYFRSRNQTFDWPIRVLLRQAFSLTLTLILVKHLVYVCRAIVHICSLIFTI